jgi:cytoskeletal protein CcmA (bactofilin family)
MALRDLMKGSDRTDGNAGASGDSSLRIRRTASPSTCIDAFSEVNGKIKCRDTVRIEGRVKGELRCEQNVIVAESAHIQANIEAESVVISGEVKGDITARRKITLGKAARVIGDLRTPGIVIEEGAKLEGRIVIGPDEKTATKKASPSRSTETPREAIAARGANSGSAGTTAP